jgi:hypothetical protein
VRLTWSRAGQLRRNDPRRPAAGDGVATTDRRGVGVVGHDVPALLASAAVHALPEGPCGHPLAPDDVHPVAGVPAAAEPVDGPVRTRASWASRREPER